MSTELIILLGAVLGAFAVILAKQLTKLLIEKQVPLDDLDAIVKALFELELNREFFIRLAIGTGIGAFGAFASLAALVAGAPVGGDGWALVGYGFAWGFAGNGIYLILRLIPSDILNALKANAEIKALKTENAGLKQQNEVLRGANLALTNSGQAGQQEPLK
ncbi:MAG: hypothetical protein R2685_10560 [Candidatus Nitrosocosmicus sp.]|nr:hypothetical protein [Candidatus Nitrosocosmicus sp.]